MAIKKEKKRVLNENKKVFNDSGTGHKKVLNCPIIGLSQVEKEFISKIAKIYVKIIFNLKNNQTA